MDKSEKSFNKIMVGNISFLLALLVLTIGCWNEYSWYEFLAPYGTLVSFLALGITFLCYADFTKIFKDPFFYGMILAGLLAGIHLILIHSNKGAFLTVADLLLVIWLFDKIVLPKKVRYALTGYIAFYFFYWTIDVKGYFKGYNTNYGGLVLITGFVFSLVALFVIREELALKGKITPARLMIIPVILVFALGYGIISWYRARCALLGFLVLIFLVILPKKILKNRVFYWLLTFAMTFGSILVSIVYVLLGWVSDRFTVQIFYKNIISGREEIWTELWDAFMHSPVTGIGSSYQMKLEWMEGLFEVHNGLLDIMFVHGFFVFLIVTLMLFIRIWRVREKACGSMPKKCALAGVFAILASSFLENFFIVPPFLLCFLALGAVINSEEKETDSSNQSPNV